MTADYLFIHAILITMRGNGVGILEDGAVAVTGNRISAVGATKEVLQDWSAHRVIDASGKVVMPGLIDAHIHTGDGLVRGVSQDLNNWMQHGLWPFEQELRKDVDAVCKGSLMNIVEALKAGTTTFCDFDTPMTQIVQTMSRLEHEPELPSLSVSCQRKIRRLWVSCTPLTRLRATENFSEIWI